jgi:hypothetical protein
MFKYVIVGLIVSNIAFGDAYTGKEDITKDEKPSTIYQIEPRGRLLPFKTYTGVDDGKDRPKWWNGYGVDPSGVNYWRYYSEETICYEGYKEVWEGTGECTEAIDAEEGEVGSIPEPGMLGLLLMGILQLRLRLF